MQKEASNPKFRFFFDINSEEHRYYRWKVYSLSQVRQLSFHVVVSGVLHVMHAPPSTRIHAVIFLYARKFFVVLQKDTMTKWRQTPFQMIEDGPYWIPPPAPGSATVHSAIVAALGVPSSTAASSVGSSTQSNVTIVTAIPGAITKGTSKVGAIFCARYLLNAQASARV